MASIGKHIDDKGWIVDAGYYEEAFNCVNPTVFTEKIDTAEPQLQANYLELLTTLSKHLSEKAAVFARGIAGERLVGLLGFGGELTRGGCSSKKDASDNYCANLYAFLTSLCEQEKTVRQTIIQSGGVSVLSEIFTSLQSVSSEEKAATRDIVKLLAFLLLETEAKKEVLWFDAIEM